MRIPRRRAVLLLPVLILSACATSLTPHTPAHQALFVAGGWDGAYVRTQQAVLRAGLQITTTQETAHSLTAVRPTGETVVVIITRSLVGNQVIIEGRPPHDVRDIVAAIKQAGH
jgi:hypothetical protein